MYLTAKSHNIIRNTSLRSIRSVTKSFLMLRISKTFT